MNDLKMQSNPPSDGWEPTFESAAIIEMLTSAWYDIAYQDPEFQEFLSWLLTMPGLKPKFGPSRQYMRELLSSTPTKPAYLQSRQGLVAVRQSFERQKDQKHRTQQEAKLKNKTLNVKKSTISVLKFLIVFEV